MFYKIATNEDIEELMQIRLEMLRVVNQMPVDSGFTEELISNSRRYFLEGDQATCFATDNGRTIGCASISYIEVMPTFSHPTGRRAHLMNVYTKEEYRRQGIAGKNDRDVGCGCEKERRYGNQFRCNGRRKTAI